MFCEIWYFFFPKKVLIFFLFHHIIHVKNRSTPNKCTSNGYKHCIFSRRNEKTISLDTLSCLELWVTAFMLKNKHLTDHSVFISITISPDKALFQLKSTGNFSYSCTKTYVVYSLEVPLRGASNEYLQHVFAQKSEKNYPDTPLYLEL